MKRLLLIAALAPGLSGPAGADGLFMGVNWGGANQAIIAPHLPAANDPEVHAEDNDGIRAHELSRPSMQAYAPPYMGRESNDGICDSLQPRAWDDEGTIAYKNSLPVTQLYTSGQGSCASVYYPGFRFFGGQPNMALAPHWAGERDFIPSSLNYMDWTDPRYNPWMRYGG